MKNINKFLVNSFLCISLMAHSSLYSYSWSKRQIFYGIGTAGLTHALFWQQMPTLLTRINKQGVRRQFGNGNIPAVVFNIFLIAILFDASHQQNRLEKLEKASAQ